MIGFAEEFLALEHGSEDVACVFSMGLIFLDKGAEEVFCALGGDGWFYFIDGCGGEGGAPVGEGFFGGCFGFEFFPSFGGEVFAEVVAGLGIREEGGDDGLALGEGFFG